MSYFGTVPPNPWVLVLDALEKKINRHSYETWLKPTRFSHSKGPTLFVRVPNPDFCHIGEKYGDLISEAIENLGLEFLDVEFVTDEEHRPKKNDRRSEGRGTEAVAELPPIGESSGTSSLRQQRFDWDGAAQLNPKYTFDGFVIGSGNQFAHAAARAVAERPSKAYNPLFLYGGVGMGKTHLMQAIGHEIKRREPQMGICYLSAEKFTNEMIASDRPPKELAEIEDRLRSRFEWGLIADIQPPDLETKVAILQKKAESERVLLPTDVALYIASNIRSNVRELEGALIRLTAYVSLTGGDLSMMTAQEVLKNLIDSQVRKVTIESIQRAVSDQFGLRQGEIKAKNNSHSIVYPRQIAMYLAKQLTEASLPEIGRQFGGKHHTTVLHSVEKIAEARKSDKDLNRLLNKLTEILGG